jgi:hypothetical protein
MGSLLLISIISTAAASPVFVNEWTAVTEQSGEAAWTRALSFVVYHNAKGYYLG